jgi:hypothetical protein
MSQVGGSGSESGQSIHATCGDDSEVEADVDDADVQHAKPVERGRCKWIC